MTERLSPALAARLGGSVAPPRFRPDELAEGVVHLGLGAFHRAHQAVYLDDIAASGDMRWGIVGVSLRSGAVRDRLVPQSGLYTLIERDGAGERGRIVATLRRILLAPEDPAAVVAAMAQPSVHLVTLTVTEKGYCLARAGGALDTANPDVRADLDSLAAPRTAVGFLVAALAARRAADLPPFTAISCDNLPENGVLLRRAVLAMAEAHDPALGEWIAAEGAFPSSMIDRIVPAITEQAITRHARKHGYLDCSLVETEPFCQWVLEDRFAGPRPDLASVGVTLTDHVAPWEEAKLRLLNGAHSTIAYLGGLAGIEHVHEFVAERSRRALIERLWTESAATLTPPGEMDVPAYCGALMDRFANPELRHRTYQIAMDGSQKLPQRLVAPWRQRLEAGSPAPTIELGVAAWMAWQRGRDIHGRSFTVDDPLAEATATAWAAARDVDGAVAALLGLREVFGDGLHQWPDAAARVSAWLKRLLEAHSLDDVIEAAERAEPTR